MNQLTRLLLPMTVMMNHPTHHPEHGGCALAASYGSTVSSMRSTTTLSLACGADSHHFNEVRSLVSNRVSRARVVGIKMALSGRTATRSASAAACRGRSGKVSCTIELILIQLC